MATGAKSLSRSLIDSLQPKPNSRIGTGTPLLYLKDSGKHHLMELYCILHSLNAVICELTNVGQSTMMTILSNHKVDKGAVRFDASDAPPHNNALIQGFGVLKVTRTIFMECEIVLPCVRVQSVAIAFPVAKISSSVVLPLT
jgi:hypothetical protein